MRDRVKEIIRRNPLYDPVRRMRVRTARWKWERGGRPIPPPEWVKRAEILRYARHFGTKTFIESGTYLGETVAVMRHHFRRVISIELDESLFLRASSLFRRNDHVKIVHGDSAQLMGSILAEVDEPCLFWLDAHYSGGVTAHGAEETPVRRELEQILTHPLGHVILIDDAREFGDNPTYPDMAELRGSVSLHLRQLKFSVRDDIIRIHPPIVPGSLGRQRN